MKNRLLFVFIIILVAASLSGCKSERKVVENKIEKDDGEQMVIGITFDSFVIERWQRDRDVFVSACTELGAEPLVQNANGDVEEQIAQIDYFIKKKVDDIVVVPVDCELLADSVAKAQDEGIPVIAYDRVIRGAKEDLYISFDNEKVGQYMAETIIEAMPYGGVMAKINGPVKDYNVTLINRGFDKKIEEVGNIRVIAQTNVSEWIGEEAYSYLDNNRARLTNVKAIMCGNDSLAGPTIKFLTEQRMINDVTVVGQDADLDACQRIVEGTQKMTVYKPIDELAKKAAECAVTMAKGETIEGSRLLEVDDYQIPYIGIEPVKVTAENMDEVIIDSGFHLKEDVYLLN